MGRKTTLTLRLDFGADFRLGPGKVRLLEAISETGSISAAGRTMGMSYRRAWHLIDSLNRGFREPVVRTTQGGKKGGGAELTAFGRVVMARYNDMAAKASAALEAHIAAFEKAIAKKT